MSLLFSNFSKYKTKKKGGATWYVTSPPSEKVGGHVPHLIATMGAGGLRVAKPT